MARAGEYMVTRIFGTQSVGLVNSVTPSDKALLCLIKHPTRELGCSIELFAVLIPQELTNLIFVESLEAINSDQ